MIQLNLTSQVTEAVSCADNFKIGGSIMIILQGKNVKELKETINFKATEYSISGESILLSNEDGIVCVILDVGEIEAFKKISLEVGHGKGKPCLADA
jgi:hypothetical protein